MEKGKLVVGLLALPVLLTAIGLVVGYRFLLQIVNCESR